MGLVGLADCLDGVAGRVCAAACLGAVVGKRGGRCVRFCAVFAVGCAWCWEGVASVRPVMRRCVDSVPVVAAVGNRKREAMPWIDTTVGSLLWARG